MKQLRDYQRDALHVGVKTLYKLHGFGLLQGCGLGKTYVTLETIETLRLLSHIESVLITAPGRVVEHWVAEYANGSMPIRILDGSPANRIAILRQPFTGITVVSHDLLAWLTKQLASVPKKQKKNKLFDMLVIDEGSKFRNWSAVRTQAARYIALRSSYRMLLTATPIPNHSGEIFPQQFILDLGATLGVGIGQFRDKFMYRGGYENKEWIFDESKAAALQSIIAPYYLRQSSIDYLDIPPVTEQIVKVHLPPEAKKAYQQMEDELIAELISGTIIALSGSDRYRLCRQIASGFCYGETTPDGRPVHVAHTAKLDMVKDLLDEISGTVLVAYQFRSEHDQLIARFPWAESINGDTTKKQIKKIISQVKQAKIILVQNQAVSHGIDGLQFGCYTLIWFTLPDSGEFDQLIGRLARTGQVNPVNVKYLIAVGTIDTSILRMLKNKQYNQENLLKGLQC